MASKVRARSSSQVPQPASVPMNREQAAAASAGSPREQPADQSGDGQQHHHRGPTTTR
jgi:hypothetical protein